MSDRQKKIYADIRVENCQLRLRSFFEQDRSGEKITGVISLRCVPLPLFGWRKTKWLETFASHGYPGTAPRCLCTVSIINNFGVRRMAGQAVLHFFLSHYFCSLNNRLARQGGV